MTKYSDYLVRTKSNGDLVPVESTQSNRTYTFCIKLKQEVSAEAKLRVSRRNNTTSSLNVSGIYNATQPSSPVNNPSIVSVPGASVNKTAFGTCLKSWATTTVPAIPISCVGASPSSATMLINGTYMAVNDVEIGQWGDLVAYGFPPAVTDHLIINLNGESIEPYIVDGPFDIPQRHPIFDFSGMLRAAQDHPNEVIELGVSYNGLTFTIKPGDQGRIGFFLTMLTPDAHLIGSKLHFYWHTDPNYANYPFRLTFTPVIPPELLAQYPDFITYDDTTPSSASSFLDYGNGLFGFNVETMTTFSDPNHNPILSHHNHVRIASIDTNNPTSPDGKMYFGLSLRGINKGVGITLDNPSRARFEIPLGATLEQIAEQMNQMIYLYNSNLYGGQYYAIGGRARMVNGELFFYNGSQVSLITLNFYGVDVQTVDDEGTAYGVYGLLTTLVIHSELQIENYPLSSFTMAPMGTSSRYVTITAIDPSQNYRIKFYNPYTSNEEPHQLVTWYDPLQTNNTFFTDRPEWAVNYCFCLGQDFSLIS